MTERQGDIIILLLFVVLGQTNPWMWGKVINLVIAGLILVAMLTERFFKR